jgi:hypothetical protein
MKRTALARVETIRAEIDRQTSGAIRFLTLHHHPAFARANISNPKGAHTGAGKITLAVFVASQTSDWDVALPRVGSVDFTFSKKIVTATHYAQALNVYGYIIESKKFPIEDVQALDKFLVDCGFWSGHDAAEDLAP